MTNNKSQSVHPAERKSPRRSPRMGVIAVALVSGTLLAGCGGGTTNAATPTTSVSAPANAGAGAGSPVLPVTVNPITNQSTTKALKIDSVLVENNVDATTKKTADDHLEIALSNKGSVPLTGFEVYYTITDPTTKAVESYYESLPASFEIAPGASRIVHFDNTGAADHFAVNEFSLYYTSKNPLTVDVEVSSAEAAVETLTVNKDAGGSEVAGQ